MGYSAHNERLVAYQLGSLKLYGERLPRDKGAARDTHTDVVHFFVRRFAQVERSGRFLMQVGIGVLIKAVSINALRRAFQSSADTTHNKVTAAHRSHQNAIF